jgi:hypothetical protein
MIVFFLCSRWWEQTPKVVACWCKAPDPCMRHVRNMRTITSNGACWVWAAAQHAGVSWWYILRRQSLFCLLQCLRLSQQILATPGSFAHAMDRPRIGAGLVPHPLACSCQQLVAAHCPLLVFLLPCCFLAVAPC